MRCLSKFFLLGLLLALTLHAKDKADKVLVYKRQHILRLMKDGRTLKEYKVALGPNIIGHKTRQGDGKTPEGRYILDYRNPKSQFYRSLHISYPNPADQDAAKKAGRDPGDLIMIHGIGKRLGWIGAAHRWRDWTQGCIAVTNEEIDEIWEMVDDGTPIEIFP